MHGCRHCRRTTGPRDRGPSQDASPVLHPRVCGGRATYAGVIFFFPALIQAPTTPIKPTMRAAIPWVVW